MGKQTDRSGPEISLPALTLGTWDIRTPEQADRAISAAISAGYRGIDSAACYENERVIRDAVEKSDIHRSELSLTSKLWNDPHGYDQSLRAFDRSEKELGSIDMYLIHWPGPVPGYLDTWRAFERLREEKRVRIIGVSNFMMPQLDILLAHANIRPMVNQIECHLWYVDRLLLDYCRRRNILVQGYSPLAAGSGLLSDPTLREVSARLDKTPAQMALAYLRQKGVHPIPKSSRPQRIAENAHFLDFAIPEGEMKILDKMNRLVRTNKDPMRWFDPEYK